MSSWGTGIDAGLPQPKLLLRQGDGGEGQSRYQIKDRAEKETHETDLTQPHPTQNPTTETARERAKERF